MEIKTLVIPQSEFEEWIEEAPWLLSTILRGKNENHSINVEIEGNDLLNTKIKELRSAIEIFEEATGFELDVRI